VLIRILVQCLNVSVENQFYVTRKHTLQTLLFLSYTIQSYKLQITALIHDQAIVMKYPKFGQECGAGASERHFGPLPPVN
jgi:hypothetical protein